MVSNPTYWQIQVQGTVRPYCGVGANVGDTVIELLDRLINQGYKLYMDNYYNSVALALCLLDVNTHVCVVLSGNLEVNRYQYAMYQMLTCKLEV